MVKSIQYFNEKSVPIFEKLEHNDLHYNDAKINFLNEFNEFKNNK